MEKLLLNKDCSQMSPADQEAYLRRVCEYIGLPYELDLVQLLWSQETNGTRSKRPYIIKGGTDILREKHKINTTTLSHAMVGTAIVFTCTGVNPEGRQEIASGAVDLAGLKGRDLENGIAWAQTKSNRRMTLAHIGCGLLDESEVNSADTPNPASLAELAKPVALLVVQPNAEPGKDVTITEPPFVISKEVVERVFDIGGPPNIMPYLEKVRKKRGPNKPKNTVNLEHQPETMSNPTQRDVEFFIDTNKQEVLDKPILDKPVLMTPLVPVEVKTEYHVQAPQHVGQTIVVIPPADAPIKVVTAISQEKQIEYRKRLAIYLNDVLPKAGMQHSESMGISAKIRAFARKYLQLADEIQWNQVTELQWESLMSYLDSYLAVEGAQALVKLIDQTVQTTQTVGV